jgi:hypothetical protein
MGTPVFDGVIYDHDNQYEQDKRLYVQFFVEAVQNNFKSLQEGRPIFDEVRMVRVMTPGSRDIMVNKATIQYQQRFPKEWAAFLQGLDVPLEGTPIEEVPFLSVGQIAELKAINVRTLEGLAHMPDNLAQQFMGNHALRQKALTYLQAAKDNAPNIKMQEELAKRDEELAELRKQLADISSQIKQGKAASEVKMTPQPQMVTALPLPAN